MEALVCPQCGSKDFRKIAGGAICTFCGTKFLLGENEEKIVAGPNQMGEPTHWKTTIDLTDDVSQLLQRWQEDPEQAGKFASLILDLDPTNEMAATYLAQHPQKRRGSRK